MCLCDPPAQNSNLALKLQTLFHRKDVHTKYQIKLIGLSVHHKR